CGLSPNDPETNTISASTLTRFLRHNSVDYIKETDFFHFFNLFDKDKDGNIDFDDFLQFVLPYDDAKLRAKIS
ncbi:MAG: EF-hand domain-containing protein, partial [bacterium]